MNILFSGQKKPQDPLCIPNPETFCWAVYNNLILGHGSSSRRIFFLHGLSIRLQSFVIPAEGNIIKPFIKGFSRQLLYKLLRHASGFVVAVGLGPHAKCFNTKTAFDPRKAHTVYFSFTAPNAQVHSQCLKTSLWKIKRALFTAIFSCPQSPIWM